MQFTTKEDDLVNAMKSCLSLASFRRAGLFAAILLGGAMFSSDAHAASISCTVSEIANFSNRVHIRCVNSVRDPATGANIFFFAVPTSNTALAQRVITLGGAALTSNRRLFIQFTDGDLSGTPFGCLSGDCRIPTLLVTQ
jgi:hypothetical protein